MKLLISFLIVALSAGSAFADELSDSNSACISKDRIGKFASHFPLFRNYRGRDLCATDDARVFRLAQALVFMEDIKLSGPNSASGDGLVIPLLGDSWSEYFAEYVANITLESSCEDPARIAYMWNFTPSEKRTMHICPAAFDPAISSLNSFVVTLMHEAWHMKDNNGTLHVECTRGLFKGKEVCDEDLAFRGAHAVSSEVLAKIIVRGENVNPVAKEDARSYLVLELMNLLNKDSVDRQERPLLLTKDGKLVLLAENRADVQMENLAPGVLAPRFDHGIAVFAARSGKVETVSRSLKKLSSVPEVSVDPVRREYNSMSLKARENVRSVHFGDIVSAIVSTNRILATCNRSGEEITSAYVLQTVKTKGVKLKSIIYPDGLVDGEKIRLLSESGLWADLSCNPDGDAVISKWSKPLIPASGKIIKFGKILYGLSKDGFLLERNADDTQATWVRNETVGEMVFSDFTSYQWIRYLGHM